MGRRPIERIDQRIALLIQQSTQYITSPQYLSILLESLVNKNLNVQPWERSKMKAVVTNLTSSRDKLNELLEENDTLPVKKNDIRGDKCYPTSLNIVQCGIKAHKLLHVNPDVSKSQLNRLEFGAASAVTRFLKEAGVDNTNELRDIVNDPETLNPYVQRYLDSKK